jgi:RNA polymerase sigma factor (sigma-70 family)
MQELVQKLRDQLITFQEKEELFHELTPLAVKIAKNLATGYLLRKRDDIIAEAMFLLFKFINQAATSLVDNNIEMYLSLSIRNSLLRYIKEDSLVRVAEATQRRTGTKFARVDLSEIAELSARGESNFNEEIEDLTTNPLEQKILQLRLQSFTFKEIGQKLKLSPSKIHMLCTKLGEIYEKRNGQRRRRTHIRSV